MKSVRERMDEVACGVAVVLGQVPDLAVLSLGEQGHAICGNSEHGNLMRARIAVASDVLRVRPIAGRSRV